MKAKKKQRMPINLPDYHRAFRVMHGILESENATPQKACLFFANAGAAILRKHYRLNAVVNAGAAFYKLDDNESSQILSYADVSTDGFTSHSAAFHAWIECDGWIIDFMAPFFPEAMEDAQINNSFPRKMFQKNMSSMARSINDLEQIGDFFHEPNLGLTQELQSHLSKNRANADLENIVVKWFARNPKKLPAAIPIRDQNGKINHVNLSKLSIDGAW